MIRQSIYLEFYISMIVAVILHLTIIGAWGKSFMPSHVTEIPFKAISIKLMPYKKASLNSEIQGGSHDKSEIAVHEEEKPIVQEIKESSNQNKSELKAAVEDNVIVEIQKEEENPVLRKPKENKYITARDDKKAGKRIVRNVSDLQKRKAEISVKPGYSKQQIVAVANTVPKSMQHAQESGLSGGGGNIVEREREIIIKYEQLVSLWLEKHKMIPVSQDAARYGEVILRIQLNRQGEVMFYKFEKTSGNSTIDFAVSKMVEKANPFPSVPADYPPGNRIEFLIPIRFMLD